jgi:recombination protein RecA
MAVAHDVKALFEKLSCGKLEASFRTPPLLPIPQWPELEAVLPDGGFPRGVVELACPRFRPGSGGAGDLPSQALGGATSVALAAVRAGQSRGEHAWCAWVDPEGSLYAPGVVAAGVDLARLLVVRSGVDHAAAGPRTCRPGVDHAAAEPRTCRPPMGRIAVKIVGAGAFEVVVVDVDTASRGGRARNPELLVRKLALAAEPSGTTVLLLTDASRPRAAPWPVALRLELSRPERGTLCVRVAKEKHGRSGLAKTIPFLPMAAWRPSPLS